tara:strand:- start:1024 stop:1455 length:432 start_codon:yes stop_codon:yes gene_type:complete
MRHFKRGRKLNRTSSHRSALLSNLASSFIIHKQITTTHPKALELKSYVERLITYAKKDSLHGRRLILKKIKGKLSKKITNILMHDLAPNYIGRNGGYTRIIKIDNRKNDNAKMCLIEFVDLKNNGDTDSIEDADNKKDKKKED